MVWGSREEILRCGHALSAARRHPRGEVASSPMIGLGHSPPSYTHNHSNNNSRGMSDAPPSATATAAQGSGGPAASEAKPAQVKRRQGRRGEG